jgi:hypothetical protein
VGSGHAIPLCSTLLPHPTTPPPPTFPPTQLLSRSEITGAIPTAAVSEGLGAALGVAQAAGAAHPMIPAVSCCSTVVPEPLSDLPTSAYSPASPLRCWLDLVAGFNVDPPIVSI